MNEHLHTGPLMFMYVGVSAVVFMNILRFLAVWLEDKSPQVARALGAMITFSGSTR